MSKAIVFGAGNIGRSFVGRLFAAGGWDTAFVDVYRPVVEALNARKGYEVVVKRRGRPDESIEVRGVRALDGNDVGAVAEEIAGADCLATCVGKAHLPGILPPIAKGLLLRDGGPRAAEPLDLILAENDREARQTAASGLAALLPAGYPLAERLGLVETSIGKMVPIMRAADKAADPLRVFAEAYDSLIVDGRGFKGKLPSIPGLKPVDDIDAYVDRKLFIHNLGHAAVAFLGFRADPSEKAIWKALELPGVRAGAKRAMKQAAAALALEYPDAYVLAELEEHIEDLLERFANDALGDTVFRVGKDLQRKIDRSDRVLGAILLCEKWGLPWDAIGMVFHAALGFAAADEDGARFAPDADFVARASELGLEGTLCRLCRLDPADPRDARVIGKLREMGTGALDRITR